ncbi:MAG: MFS transporter [Chloroflexi bacterium]|nr:MFS transporter [Chloroflexota bacterium]
MPHSSVLLNHQAAKRVEHALRNSTVESMAYGAVQGLGDHFLFAYAVAIGASHQEVALLASLPMFLGALTQALSARAVALVGSRKGVAVLFAALSGLMWLPILSLGLLSPSYAPLWLIALALLYAAFNGVVGPAWGSLMAEVVPDRLRGHYFGQRNRWSTVSNMISFLMGGGLLFLLRDRGFWGFALVFALAFLARVVSAALLTTLVEAPHSPTEEERVGLLAFWRQLRRSNFGRFVLYLFAVNFVVNLASPFFVPYMLQELKMDYLTFTVLEVLSILAGVWAVTHWGAAADRAGTLRALQVAGILIGIVPLVWALSGNVVYLGFVEFFTGLAWVGFNLASSNFLFDATTSRNRTAYLAYVGAGMGLSSALGALAGGLLISLVPPLVTGSAIITVFIISGILRLLAGLVFLSRVHEVRSVRQVASAELFHIMLGGKTAHRPAGYGRLHHHLQGYGGDVAGLEAGDE